MNDKMTATERLRQLLDERGVEWHGVEGVWWGDFDAMESIWADDALDVTLYGVSPEQAVEATLGPAVPPPEPPDVPYDILIDELRDTWGIEASWDGLRKFWYLGWTEEYVEDMGRLHDELRDSIVELLGSRCDWVQTGVTHAHMVLDRAAQTWRGTCHIVKTWSDSDYVDGWRYRCSECECPIPVDERDPETGDVISAANYCPNCGRKVDQ